MWFWIVLVSLAVAIAAYAFGARTGKAFWAEELAIERELKAKVIAERDALAVKVNKAKMVAGNAGLEIKKLFPFL